MQRSILILFLCFLISSAIAQEYKGRVVGISDGDTFTLLTADKKQIKVRLAEIDTPERAQPYGTRARQALSDLIFGKDVRVIEADTDRYGRLVGHVFLGETHINRKLVQGGMAWVYRQYMKDESLLQDELEAREAKRGLWSLPNTDQIPPWEWRRGNQTTVSSPEGKEAKPNYECGAKRYCKEMSSCEEAKYYLEHCNLTRLDGDGDGVPCESLCN
jgi:endonuclease YncB( thermonuclease family)